MITRRGVLRPAVSHLMAPLSLISQPEMFINTTDVHVQELYFPGDILHDSCCWVSCGNDRIREVLRQELPNAGTGQLVSF